MVGVLLVVYAFVAFLISFGIFSTSKNALHEILAGIILIISSIFFAGAHIIAAIGQSKKKQIELLTQIKNQINKLNDETKTHNKKPDGRS